MFKTIAQVNEQFFQKFHGVSVVVNGVSTPILYRYAKKSSKDYTEEQEQQIYPCFAIQDYNPTVKQEWWIDLTRFEHVDLEEDADNALLYSRPVWMSFVFDVSIAAKSYHEYTALKDYMLARFNTTYVFLFDNPDLFETETSIIRIPYKLTSSDIPRNDGVFETNFSFDLSVWMLPNDPEVVTLIKSITIELHQSTI